MAVTHNDRQKNYHFSAASDSTVDNIKIVAIRWIGADTAGDSLVISDNQSTPETLFESVADADNFIDTFYFVPYHTAVGGITVTTMGSGELYVYYR